MRKSVASSLSPYPPLEPIPTSSKASVAQLQRQNRALEEQNNSLKSELSNIRSLYKQLVQENSHENFDERRLNLLKSQNIQLERQVLLLNEALGSRSETLLEVENGLSAVSEFCQHQLTKDGQRIGEIQVLKADLKQALETAESCRIKLYKNIENTSAQRFEQPLMWTSPFIKPGAEPVTLLDVCSGSLEHINLKHVAELESKLAVAYGQLIQINQSLQSILKSNSKTSKPKANHHAPRSVYLRLGGQVARTCHHLEGTVQGLQELSLLVPAAPWSSAKRGKSGNITVDSVMNKLPAMSKSKHSEASSVVESLIQAVNYRICMDNIQNKSLEEELKFHKAVYHLQLEYLDVALVAIKQGYDEFEREANDVICKPLKECLRVYSSLQKTADEDTLRRFLSTFKDNADKIDEAIRRLEPAQKEDPEEAMSQFAEEFYRNVDKLQRECQSRRDKLSHDIQILQEDYDRNKQDVWEFSNYNIPTEHSAERKISPRKSNSPQRKSPRNLKTPNSGRSSRSPKRGSNLDRAVSRTNGYDKSCDVEDGYNVGNDNIVLGNISDRSLKSSLQGNFSQLAEEMRQEYRKVVNEESKTDRSESCGHDTHSHRQEKTKQMKAKRTSSVENRPAWDDSFAQVTESPEPENKPKPKPKKVKPKPQWSSDFASNEALRNSPSPLFPQSSRDMDGNPLTKNGDFANEVPSDMYLEKGASSCSCGVETENPDLYANFERTPRDGASIDRERTKFNIHKTDRNENNSKPPLPDDIHASVRGGRNSDIEKKRKVNVQKTKLVLKPRKKKSQNAPKQENDSNQTPERITMAPSDVITVTSGDVQNVLTSGDSPVLRALERMDRTRDDNSPVAQFNHSPAENRPYSGLRRSSMDSPVCKDKQEVVAEPLVSAHIGAFGNYQGFEAGGQPWK